MNRFEKNARIMRPHPDSLARHPCLSEEPLAGHFGIDGTFAIRAFQLEPYHCADATLRAQARFDSALAILHPRET